ncbi:stage III sporulation protein AF [Paenibacillus daejeonensis]|uniref:stage III sporulation protein AF n=1 Tax=Paenibacillus daejeonensis TaxID=135193 RepID=UPI00037BEBEB|nr:stage III sporulation protein AF [Paenibacillus daejeonensis]
MAWLAEWLKQIIAIILLAGIVELLLPSNAYQRYVRLVLGLFILLALLSPILSLLQGEFGPRLEASIRDWQGSAARQAVQTGHSLTELQQQAAVLNSRQQDQAAELAAAKLAGEMAAEISRRSGAPQPRVEVLLEAESGGYWRISKVAVSLAEEMEEGNASTSPSISSPEPIEPVAVEVWLGSTTDHPEPQQATREASERWQQVIRTILADGWGVASELIQVTQAGGE